jgi:hypothetical protein
MAVPLVDIAPTPHLTLVRLIRQAQVAGFKLAEMIPLIAAKNALKTSAPQRTAHAMWLMPSRVLAWAFWASTMQGLRITVGMTGAPAVATGS